MEIIEYNDVYAINLHRNVKQRQQVDTDNGLTIEFGFNYQGGRCKLTAVLFDKNLWTYEEVYDWWIDHEVRFIPVKKANIMVSEIDFWLDPICDNYIVICYRGQKKETFIKILRENTDSKNH